MKENGVITPGKGAQNHTYSLKIIIMKGNTGATCIPYKISTITSPFCGWGNRHREMTSYLSGVSRED